VAIASMTGFGAVSGDCGGYTWSWELRSVNSRSLDLRMRLPSGLETVEPDLRKAVTAKFARGNISVYLSLKAPEKDTRYSINENAFADLQEAASALAEKFGLEKPGTDALLALRGVIEIAEEEPTEEEKAALHAALKESFSAALDRLAENREAEGARLYEVMSGVVDEIESLLESVTGSAEAQPDAIRERLLAKIDDLLAGDERMAPERLAQEVSLLAVKADIREETDRLRSHIAAARELLESDEPVGRKLDFLSQEFNREANTICSKAATIEVTDTGLALKAAIDRIREQVQNIE